MLGVRARDHSCPFQLIERDLQLLGTFARAAAVGDRVEEGPEARGRVWAWLGFTDRFGFRQHQLRQRGRTFLRTQGGARRRVHYLRVRGT